MFVIGDSCRSLAEGGYLKPLSLSTQPVKEALDLEDNLENAIQANFDSQMEMCPERLQQHQCDY